MGRNSATYAFNLHDGEFEDKLQELHAIVRNFKKNLPDEDRPERFVTSQNTTIESQLEAFRDFNGENGKAHFGYQFVTVKSHGSNLSLEFRSQMNEAVEIALPDAQDYEEEKPAAKLSLVQGL